MQWICIVLLHVKFRFNLSNSVVGIILCCFAVVFAVLCYPVVGVFPTSMKSLLKFSGAAALQPTRTSFVVCPNDKCNALYMFEDLLKYNAKGEIVGAKHCTARLGRSRKKLCGTELLYQKKIAFTKNAFAAHKTYEFISPSSWLHTFFKNEAFCNLLDNVPQQQLANKMTDIRHGKLWKEFLVHPETKEDLLANKHNLAFMMNVDWFDPFKRSSYKIGAIYLSVLNLPRSERFKVNRIMLVGLIPGPGEPVEHINTFLKPVVDDLIVLWKGKVFIDFQGKTIHNKSMLLCISSDLPATRKLTQFKSHKCLKSCDKCNFTAIRQPGTKGASGKMSFETAKRPNRPSPRTNKSVRKAAEEFKNAKSQKEAKEKAKSTGVKHSDLLRLPYFDPVRMVVVDPMHAFLLGLVRNETEKHLDNEQFHKRYSMPSRKKKEFVRRLKEMKVPYDVGRLPVHMNEKKTLRGLTAEQFKNYILIYAKACLVNLIPQKAYACFGLLSDAVKIITLPSISFEEISELEDILEEHHQQYTSLYGKWAVSINYHMVLHIPDMMRDFGPATGFWCFPFERYNGVLERIPNSRRSVEEQFMNSFQNICLECDSTLPSSVPADIVPSSLSKLLTEREQSAEAKILENDLKNESVNLFYATAKNLPSVILQVELEEVKDWPVFMLSPKKENVQITLQFRNQLIIYYRKMYSAVELVHARVHKHGRCFVNGITFTSGFNSSEKGNIVKAYFPASVSNPCPSELYGKVLFFFKSKVYFKNNEGHIANKMHHLAYVTWLHFSSLKETPLEKKTGMFTVKSKVLDYEPIVNVRRLVKRCVLASTKAKDNCFLVVEL